MNWREEDGTAGTALHHQVADAPVVAAPVIDAPVIVAARFTKFLRTASSPATV